MAGGVGGRVGPRVSSVARGTPATAASVPATPRHPGGAATPAPAHTLRLATVRCTVGGRRGPRGRSVRQTVASLSRRAAAPVPIRRRSTEAGCVWARRGPRSTATPCLAAPVSVCVCVWVCVCV
ncbi:hypothetical protein GWK47_043456 [Chionoecetes opilio]|uniref:Uncharacterized protein n=1 Tax=Chionoecetes opilio TaxID=41210 RepID=A0A8J4YHH5_CHIOP|nr:hypothetical protein GWK47_043456 [Chionoecetes opilio]